MPHPDISASLITVLLAAGLVLVLLLVLIAGWFLARQKLLAPTVAVIVGLLLIALLVRLHELLVMLLLAAALAFILDGAVQRLERRLPRWAAIVTVYLLLVGALTAAGVLLLPRLVGQAQHLGHSVPNYVRDLQGHFTRLTAWYAQAPEAFHKAVDSAVEAGRARSEAIVTAAASMLIGMVGWFVKGILILVLSIYLLIDKDRLRDMVFRVTPDFLHEDVKSTLTEIGAAIGGYLRAQLSVILFVAVSVTTVLLLFRIPHALFIGLAAGVLEVIPYFGAFAGAVPAVAIGFTKSWVHGVGLIIAFIAINQIEGHVVLPLVVGHHLEMRPLWILVSLLAGHLLFGVVGMIIAVPLVSIVRIIVPRLYRLYQALHRHEQQSPEGVLGPGGAVSG